MEVSNSKKIHVYQSREEWSNEGVRLFGPNIDKWKFVCCNCGNVQSMEDFKRHGIEQPESKAHFSCIGRWIGGQGTIFNDPIQPCNYTLGGLFRLNNAALKENDEEHPIFEFAITPEKERLYIYVICEHPSDFPDKYTVRRQWTGKYNNEIPVKDLDYLILKDDLKSCREEMRKLGLVPMMRDEKDDPVIVESWI